ncbi:rhodanese-like domain-containing protein [Kiloniella laminariae]|uniref:Rhodanese-like domain-containing protein n=1 Tax=Kiloniella laminariae TaxID=454162 RepID=A0ABT4LIH5_9PROT|nr:rhodanese-like domain-containing protein [Kiloniella laminariae]MCZ4280914.1 rhodanese-like domain-containing protein [Kiloniella laminariae]
MGQDYAGDVSVTTAWKALQEDQNAILVDVRTIPEFQFVGVPDLSAAGKQVHCLSWQVYPQMQVNPNFVEAIQELATSEDQAIYLLCRSGVRSVSAAVALTAAGFKNCYNIEQGFEGPPDPSGHRGAIAGWKASGLPWKQN